ncbi:DUF4123 domain-containing protein [Mesorhizobium sp. BAC0120]|uniref:DUF4123 domain-containing protein n=1 Tax=Mesorhizobium sp. BAC0120 TaxID=3090670 RepID=UPI00298C82FD|nr:DUF4123 domain-containing protein [Mesorhizobium sp. BAC0120]MDW6025440.1 DUF4123 domain-containing protein [Mesorhizobium sp. BAC0120]
MTAGAETLYAVIDTARDARLYGLVMQASDQACLFGGELAEPLNRAAPYLVDLKSREPLFNSWRDEGRGQSWGIMARSAMPLGELRRHFRRFMVAKLPDGMVAQFRFYDPRVFGPYLSSCTPEELAPWFEGVSAYLVENREAGGFHEFTLREGQLHDRAAE